MEEGILGGGIMVCEEAEEGVGSPIGATGKLISP